MLTSASQVHSVFSETHSQSCLSSFEILVLQLPDNEPKGHYLPEQCNVAMTPQQKEVQSQALGKIQLGPIAPPSTPAYPQSPAHAQKIR